MKQSSGMKNQWSVTVLKKACLMAVFFFFTLHALSLPGLAAEVVSKAAVVMDASTGRMLYGKNPNLRLPPASTTKLMTAMVVLDRKRPDDMITISEKAAAISPVKAHFKVGEKVSVETLLHAALIKSANDAAFALAEAVGGTEERFVELMNQKVIALGMPDSNFINATGLPGHGQYTTGYDLAKMLRHALRYPLIKEVINIKASRISTEEGRAIFIKNSNRLLWSDESVVGGKTGYTRAAKHCFVCASEQGPETVIVALLGAPSRERLWRESEELMEKGFAIMSGKEDPVMYFSRADYKATVQPASYTVKSSGVKDPSQKQASKKAGAQKAKKSVAKKRVKSKPKGAAQAGIEKVYGAQG